MRQRKKEKRKKKNLQRIKREETQNASVYYGKHESGEKTLYNPPPLPSLSTPLPMFFLFDTDWKQRFEGDKLKYFISDVTNAPCSYRVCSFFFRMNERSKDRPRLCRHHGFGSVLRRAVSYQLINFLYKFTALDHFDGFQFLPGSTAWIITEHLEVFNRASKWGWSKTIKKKRG